MREVDFIFDEETVRTFVLPDNVIENYEGARVNNGMLEIVYTEYSGEYEYYDFTCEPRTVEKVYQVCYVGDFGEVRAY